MKKTFFLLNFILVVQQLLAQSKIYSATHFSSNEPKNSRTEYVHTYSNGSETIVRWLYVRPDSAPQWVSRQTLRFDAQKRLLSDETIGTTKESKTSRLVSTNYITANTYNTNGCRTRQQRSYSENNVLKRQFTVDSKVNDRCLVQEDRLTAGVLVSGATQFQTYLQSVKTYTYDARDSVQFIRYAYSSDSGYLAFTRRPIDGKEETIENYDVCDFCIDVLPKHTKSLISYDPQGRVVLHKTFENKGTKQIPNWRLWDSTTLAYSDNRLVRETQFTKYQLLITPRLVDTFSTDFKYDLYCDGLVKEVQTTNSFQSFGYQSTWQERVLYKYTEGVTCAAAISAAFKVYPNPSTWRLTIETEALFTADFKVLIFNNLGQEMARYNVDYRTPVFDFPIANLPNGTYLVRLVNGEKSYAQKVVVAR